MLFFLAYLAKTIKYESSPPQIINPLDYDIVISGCFFYDTSNSINIKTDDTFRTIVISYNNFHYCNDQAVGRTTCYVFGNFYLSIVFNCFQNCTGHRGCTMYENRVRFTDSTSVLDTNSYAQNGGERHTIHINQLKAKSKNIFKNCNFTECKTIDSFGIVFIEESEITEKFNLYSRCANSLCILAHASSRGENEGLVCINNTIVGRTYEGGVYYKCFGHYGWSGVFATTLKNAYFYGNILASKKYDIYVSHQYPDSPTSYTPTLDNRQMLYIINCYSDHLRYSATHVHVQTLEGSPISGLVLDDIPVYNIEETVNCYKEEPDATPAATATPKRTPMPTPMPTATPKRTKSLKRARFNPSFLQGLLLLDYFDK